MKDLDMLANIGSSQTEDSSYMEFSSIRNQPKPHQFFEYFVRGLLHCKWATGVNTEAKS